MFPYFQWVSASTSTMLFDNIVKGLSLRSLAKTEWPRPRGPPLRPWLVGRARVGGL